MSKQSVRASLSLIAVLALVLTLTGPLGVAASVSGDNGRIAFVSDRDGNTEIYSMKSDGSDPVNLTNNPASDSQPNWSPDGLQIVFVSDRGGADEIFLMNADGSNVRRLTDGTDPTWSPDGEQIAFTKSPDGTWTEVYTIDVDGSSLTRITDSSQAPRPDWADEVSASAPSWSPDGSQLAFLREYSGPTPTAQSVDLYVMGADGGDPRFLAQVGWDADAPDWAPDGLRIAVGEIGTHMLSAQVTVVHVDGSGQETMPVPDGFDSARQPAWSPDGKRIAMAAFTVNITPHEIVTADSDDGGSPINLTNHAAFDKDPAWQPLNPYPVGLVDPTTGIWHLRDARGEVSSFYYGNPGDEPFMGDWDCDGVATPGLYRRSDGYVYLRNSNTQGVADIRFFFGDPGDIPIAGDFNGNGCDTVSLYRPSEQRFYIINELGSDDEGLGAAEHSFLFGDPDDKPFVGDFDGDGIDEIALHRESTGRVYLRFTLTTGVADLDFIYGDPGDRVMSGDWNGDGTETPAVFRPSNTTFYFRFLNSSGFANAHFIWGRSDWLPVSIE